MTQPEPEKVPESAPEKSGLSRRDVLAAAVPASLAVGMARVAVAGPGGAPADAPLRAIQGVYAPPPLHWVGDGFHVAGYFNRVPDALLRLDPFVLLDYAPVANFPPTTQRRGVGPHPHRGFETVTFAFQGSVAHHDSTGAGGIIGPGDVQWMTAGSGILHREYHESGYGRRGGPFQMVQLWVNLPRVHKMTAPTYQPLVASQMGVLALPEGAGEIRAVAGEHLGARGPARTFTPMTILDIRLAAGRSHEVVTPDGHTTALLVMGGAATLQGKRAVRQDDFVVFERQGSRVRIDATAPSRFLLLSGAPIGEPVVQYGPFVMNTQEEIQRAYADFRAGKFGRLDD